MFIFYNLNAAQYDDINAISMNCLFYMTPASISVTLFYYVTLNVVKMFMVILSDKINGKIP